MAIEYEKISLLVELREFFEEISKKNKLAYISYPEFLRDAARDKFLRIKMISTNSRQVEGTTKMYLSLSNFWKTRSILMTYGNHSHYLLKNAPIFSKKGYLIAKLNEKIADTILLPNYHFQTKWITHIP